MKITNLKAASKFGLVDMTTKTPIEIKDYNLIWQEALIQVKHGKVKGNAVIQFAEDATV